MKILLGILLIFTVLFVAVGCETKTPEQQIAEYEVLFNQYRADKGLKPLIFLDDLNYIAALRLEEIKVNFSHDSAGNYGQHVAENLIKGIRNNDQALKCWDASPLHQYNMITDSVYTGYAIGDGYAVQLFSDYITIDGIPQLPDGYYWPDD